MVPEEQRCKEPEGEQAYPTLTYYNKVDKGGHFAA
jgi:hypothetical protein